MVIYDSGYFFIKLILFKFAKFTYEFGCHFMFLTHCYDGHYYINLIFNKSNDIDIFYYTDDISKNNNLFDKVFFMNENIYDNYLILTHFLNFL